MKTKLSERIRPNSEAAPWIIEEIKQLENNLEMAKSALEAWDNHIDISIGVDEDDDEGFLAILHSRTEAIQQTLNSLKVLKEKEEK